MNPISKYKGSSINIISIRYEKEDININLARAAKISEQSMEAEIKGQPSYYFFLFSLHKKLLTKFELLKLQRKSTYGRLYAMAKDRKSSSTGRYLSEAAVKAWVESHKKYLKASENCIRVRDQADQVLGAVRAFEQRKDLMQSLSANLRKERI